MDLNTVVVVTIQRKGKSSELCASVFPIAKQANLRSYCPVCLQWSLRLSCHWPVQIKAVEVPIAEAMLSGLVAVSGSLTAVDEEDARLEGKLGLLLELVTVLDRRHIGTASGGGLVHRIITGWSPSRAPAGCGLGL